MKKVIGYIRVKPEQYEQNKAVLQIQKEKIELYCRLYNLELIRIVTDIATGSIVRRKGLKTLNSLLSQGMANGIVITDLKTLSNSPVQIQVLLKNFFSHHYFLHAVHEQIDTSKATGRVVLKMLLPLKKDRLRKKDGLLKTAFQWDHKEKILTFAFHERSLPGEIEVTDGHIIIKNPNMAALFCGSCIVQSNIDAPGTGVVDCCDLPHLFEKITHINTSNALDGINRNCWMMEVAENILEVMNQETLSPNMIPVLVNKAAQWIISSVNQHLEHEKISNIIRCVVQYEHQADYKIEDRKEPEEDEVDVDVETDIFWA